MRDDELHILNQRNDRNGKLEQRIRELEAQLEHMQSNLDIERLRLGAQSKALTTAREALARALREAESIQNVDSEGEDGNDVADVMYELSKDVIKTLSIALAAIKEVQP